MDAVAGPSNSQRKRKFFSVGEKQIVCRVYENLKHTLCTVEAVAQCSFLTGVSVPTIERIVREKKVTGTVQAPKVHCRGRQKIELDEYQKNFVRTTIHSFFFENKAPTIESIRTKVLENDLVPKMSKETLRKIIIKDLQFKYAKRSRKSVLIEREDIVSWRRRYLRSIKEFRSVNKKIYYLDETWVNAGHTVSKIWQDTTVMSSRQAFLDGLSTGLRRPTGRGQRLIVAHIGSESGFLDDSALVFLSKKTGDYHEDMDAKRFEEWFESLLPRVERNSVIVLDNASYHSRLVELLPTLATKKADMQSWLRQKGISFSEDMVKAELMTVIRQHRDRYRQHVVDIMARARGITVLRLPPYHCELNPIELIWAQVKDYVARENVTYKISDVQRLLELGMKRIRKEDWANAVAHVIKEEDKMWRLDGMVDNVLDKVVIDLSVIGDSSSDESQDSEAS